MKNNIKVSLVGFLVLPTAIILGLIFDLILERDLLEGLIFSISFGLIYSIGWMVFFTIRNRKKENRNWMTNLKSKN